MTAPSCAPSRPAADLRELLAVTATERRALLARRRGTRPACGCREPVPSVGEDGVGAWSGTPTSRPGAARLRPSRCSGARTPAPASTPTPAATWSTGARSGSRPPTGGSTWWSTARFADLDRPGAGRPGLPQRRLRGRRHPVVPHAVRARRAVGGPADAAVRHRPRGRHAARARPPPGPGRRPGHRGAARQDPARGALVRHRRPARRPTCRPSTTAPSTPRRSGCGCSTTPGAGDCPTTSSASSGPHLEAALGWIRRAAADGRRRLPAVPRRHRHRPGQPGLEGLRRRDATPGRLDRRGAHRPGRDPGVRRRGGVRRGRSGRVGLRGGRRGDLRALARGLAERVRGSVLGPRRRRSPIWRWPWTGTARRSTASPATWATSWAPGPSRQRRATGSPPGSRRPDLLGPFGDRDARPRQPGLQPDRLPHRLGVDPRHRDLRPGPGARRARAPRRPPWSAPWSRPRHSSSFRFPELFGGSAESGLPVPYPASCRPQAWSAASAAALVGATLGLEADVPRRHADVRPMRAAPFGDLRVRGLRVRGESVAIDVTPTAGSRTSGRPPGSRSRSADRSGPVASAGRRMRAMAPRSCRPLRVASSDARPARARGAWRAPARPAVAGLSAWRGRPWWGPVGASPSVPARAAP